MKLRLYLIIPFFLFMLLPTAVFNQSLRSTPVPTPTPPLASNREEIDEIDLAAWVKDHSIFGITKFENGEFYMRSKRKDYYYVLIAPDAYTTKGMITGVTLRNVSGRRSRSGYGLIFHSDDTPLIKDYSFLIDTIRRQYRVVHHTPNDEKTVIPWTDSNYINDGKQSNRLEAVDDRDETHLFINSHYIASVKNTYEYRTGTAGLYTSYKINIAFKNFVIRANPSHRIKSGHRSKPLIAYR